MHVADATLTSGPGPNVRVDALRRLGGITVAGFVVDADGGAVADARVSGWRERRFDPDGGERFDAQTDAAGRFAVSVRKHARYQLVASKDGCANSVLTWVETTAVRPHADARLELLALARIGGRVVHADGSPFDGVAVGAWPAEYERLQSIVLPQADELFGKVASAVTDAAGRFELAVAPTTAWDLVAQPSAGNPRLRVWRHGIAAGRDDVEIGITADDLAGCVVHGIVERSDGEPVGDFGVEILIYARGDPCGVDVAQAATVGARFTLPPLPRGREFGIRVHAGSDSRRGGALAPATIGPFATDRAELTFEFRLQPWAVVNVRVVAKDGTAARRVRVMPSPGQQRDACLPACLPMPVDADGRASFATFPPGPCRVQVFDAAFAKVCEQDCVVLPGRNPEIIVRTPR